MLRIDSIRAGSTSPSLYLNAGIPSLNRIPISAHNMIAAQAAASVASDGMSTRAKVAIAGAVIAASIGGYLLLKE